MCQVACWPIKGRVLGGGRGVASERSGQAPVGILHRPMARGWHLFEVRSRDVCRLVELQDQCD